MLALANARSQAEASTQTQSPHDWLAAFRDCASLADVLSVHAARQPDKRLYTFLNERGAEAEFVTYGGFIQRIRSVAAEIQAVTKPGDRALLLFEPGAEYMVTFFACLASGVVAVPAYPPEPHRAEWGLGRLNRIIGDATPSVLLTSESVKSRLQVLPASQLEGLSVVAIHGEQQAHAHDFRTVAVDPKLPAYLQYTSGSTMEPRGVIVTHQNIMENERMIALGFGNDQDTIVASWLPFYHDMGLIGNMLQPVFIGGQCVIMSPTAFLRQPLTWLQAISRYRATTSGAPNFGYEACVQRIRADDVETLDLSSWRTAYCGSEPIRQSTYARFVERFRPAGFDPKAFAPCYGLAEATLLVAVATPGRGSQFTRFSREELRNRRAVRDPNGVSLAACGSAIGYEEIALVDPDTHEPMAPSHVGEIWVKGPHVGGGYFGQGAQGSNTFDAFDTQGNGPYLRTGDLGFMHEGQLYIADRLKDLIIIRGQHYFPQHLEQTVENCDAALQKQACIAFSISSPDEEKLVIAVELSGPQRNLDSAQLFANILHALEAEHGVSPSIIALCKRGSLPRTSSGKLQRRLCERELLNDRLQPQWLWRATEQMQS